MRNDGSTVPFATPDLVRLLRPALGALALAMLSLTAVGWSVSRPVTPSAFDDADAGRLSVTLGPGGRDLRIAGDLLDGAADRVRALLDAHPGVERVHLTSDGGYVDEGRALGALIAERGLVAYVPDRCVSACTLAFVRGRERFVTREARLGFHAPFEEDDAGREVQVDGSQEEADYVAAGVAPDFASAAIHTPSREIWLPDAERLLAAGVITAVVDDDRFPDSTLDSEASFAAARTAVLRNVEILRGFEAAAPALVDDIAAWYLAGYREGRSEGAAIAGLDALAARAVRTVLAAAGDETLRAAGRLVAEALKTADGEPRQCAALAAPADLAAAQRTLAEAGGAPSQAADLVAEALQGRGAPRFNPHRSSFRGRAAVSEPFLSKGRGTDDWARRPVVGSGFDVSRRPGMTSGVNESDDLRRDMRRAATASCDTLRERYAEALAAPDTVLLRQLIAAPDAPAPRLEATARPRDR